MKVVILAAVTFLVAQGLITSGYSEFMSLTEIQTKISSLLSNNSAFVKAMQVTQVSLSKTKGGNQLYLLRLTNSSSPIQDDLKGRVLVTAQHHAVGMAGASMVCYLLESLLDTTNSAMVALLKAKIIYAIPVVNPDSYANLDKSSPYTKAYWKNQKSGSVACSSGQIGVNLDRNYDADFSPMSDSCNQNYTGEQAFSEIESQFVRDAVSNYNIDLVISYDLSGSLYVFPPAAATFSLRTDDQAIIDSFSASLTNSKKSTYAAADGQSANGTLIDWAYRAKNAFTVQARIGEKDLSGSELFSVLQSNLQPFLYLAERTRDYYTLEMNAPVETKCDSFACAHPWAFSTINFTAVFKNDAIGPASRGKIDVRLQLPVNSTYDFLLSNITISSEDFGATNHTLTTGVNVVWNNVTANMGSDVHILASIPSDKNRALRVVSVYIERFLKPNASEYLNETLTFSMGANIDGQDASVDYINRNSSKVFVLLKPTASEPIPQTPAANSSLAFSIGYKEPVMVGLGVLLFILFLIIAVAVCGIVWMLNKPGAEATETALLKSSTQGDRPVAESPRLPVQV